MARVFNTTGSCNPEFHYMVDIDDKLAQIKHLIDRGAYFTINRARQYGKTTTIEALMHYLEDDYIVLSLDFQALGNIVFRDESAFSKAFARYMVNTILDDEVPVMGIETSVVKDMLEESKTTDVFSLDMLFPHLSKMCRIAEKPIVMIIDEVDSATNNQVFLDFLAQLRLAYLNRARKKTFQSVILAGVHDVKNIKYKIRSEEEHKVNSPWNIAEDFLVKMSFSTDDIAGMLEEYEVDYHTGMDTVRIASLIYDYTSGYPFLVSRLCKLIDERLAGTEEFPEKNDAWNEAGLIEAVKLLLSESNSLFESLTGKLTNIPELKETISQILFSGRSIPYVATNQEIALAKMYGFIKNQDDVVTISNRIFESVLYNHLLSNEVLHSQLYEAGLDEKAQYINNGCLNMKYVLTRFVEIFDDIYGNADEKFIEDVGRKYFMLFMKPIINGVGFSYIEARTRNSRRTDMIVQYGAEQFVIEMKIWKGPKYHEDGEQQLVKYLDSYHLNTGYMLAFNFNKKKERGIKEKKVNGKTLIEAVV